MEITDAFYDSFMKNRHHVAACLNLTNQCNLRCTYCFTEHNPQKMTLETAKKAILYLCKKYDENETANGGMTVNFFGGEPMLEYETVMKPLVEWAEGLGLTRKDQYSLSFGMTTNGTLFTPERIKWCSDHKLGILLSIDGNKETQDMNRPCAKEGCSSFDLVMPNIHTLLEYYPQITFRSTVTPKSAKFLTENYVFARKMGFLNYFVMPNVYEPWEHQDICTLLSEIANVCWILYEDIKTGQTPLNFSEIAYALQNNIAPPKPAPTLTQSLSRCGIGTSSIGIATDGRIFGCQEHSTYKDDIFVIGDIERGIDPEKHKRLLKEFVKEDHTYCQENPERCKVCSYYNVCPYHTCPSQVLHNAWTFRGQPEIYCVWKDFVHKMGALMIERACEEGNEALFQYIVKTLGMPWEGGIV